MLTHVFYNNMPNYLIDVKSKKVYKFVEGYMGKSSQLKFVGKLKKIIMNKTTPLFDGHVTEDLEWDY